MRRAGVATSRNVAFNMTPMIDVIFLLIIFFLCVNQYQKAESLEAVELPEASSEKVRRPEETGETRLVVNVLADETLILGGQPVEPSRFKTLLESKKAEIAPRPLEVWIRADRQTAFRAVEPILLSCAESGIWKVAFKVIRPKPLQGGE